MSMKDCRVDFMTNTVTMTKKFYENATRPGSPEYEIYKTIRKDNPHIRPVIKSSSKKKNAARVRLYNTFPSNHFTTPSETYSHHS